MTMAIGPDRREAKGRLVRLFAGTAAVAVIFSVGLIVGQHMLMNRADTPVVSVSEAADRPDSDESPDAAGEVPTEEATAELFSFYDALTSPGVQHFDIPDATDLAARRIDGELDFDAAPDSPADDDSDGPESVHYTLHLGAFPTLEKARVRMDRLRIHELNPRLIAEEDDSAATYYRVELGEFSSEQQARTRLESLKRQHQLSGYVAPL